MFTAERPRHHLTQTFAERVLLFYLSHLLLVWFFGNFHVDAFFDVLLCMFACVRDSLGGKEVSKPVKAGPPPVKKRKNLKPA